MRSRHQLNPPTFTYGAFAQFYEADLAAYLALRAYRACNGPTPICLVSDGGDDLAELARMFDCHYVYEPVNNGTARTRHAQTHQYVWLQRLRNACLTGLAGVDWIVLLEPDVECFKPPTHLPRYPLSGPRDGPPWNETMKQWLRAEFGSRTRPGGLGHNYTGCGGSIFHRKTFLQCLEATPLETFEKARRTDWRITSAEDATLTFLFQINGFDTGDWEDFARSSEPHEGRRAFVHGNKQHYGKPMAPTVAWSESTYSVRP